MGEGKTGLEHKTGKGTCTVRQGMEFTGQPKS